MSWDYNRGRYYRYRTAVEQTDPVLLKHPGIAVALAQIDIAEAYIDRTMSLLEDAARGDSE